MTDKRQKAIQRMTADDLDFVVLESAPTRASNFNYELRHPGHGDQSVHNPHKGGGAYAPGAWRPVSKAELAAMDEAVIQDLFKNNHIANFGGNTRLGQEMRGRIRTRYMRSRAQGETYVNGNVVVRLPKTSKLDADQKQALFDDIDNAVKFTPEGMLGDKSFPIEINVGKVSGRRLGEWEGHVDGGRIGINLTHVKTRGLTDGNTTYTINKAGEIFPVQVPWHPDIATGKSSMSFTVAHEIGHAVESYKLKGGESSRYRFGYQGLPFISEYSRKNSGERYAEHFAAWTLGATDALTAEIAANDGWRRP